MLVYFAFSIRLRRALISAFVADTPASPPEKSSSLDSVRGGDSGCIFVTPEAYLTTFCFLYFWEMGREEGIEE